MKIQICIQMAIYSHICKNFNFWNVFLLLLLGNEFNFEGYYFLSCLPIVQIIGQYKFGLDIRIQRMEFLATEFFLQQKLFVKTFHTSLDICFLYKYIQRTLFFSCHPVQKMVNSMSVF